MTARDAIAQLRAAGHSAYLVGGGVRDRWLGIPASDEDIATDAVPGRLRELFPGARLVGAHFGVVIVDGVEIATYRSDSAYLDGRRPESVSFVATPEEDSRRRDFTINALYEDPFTGGILDFHGGLDDLRAGVIRAIGDPVERFEEDRLRLLRAVRFASRFGFRIEPRTFAAIRELAPRVSAVAAERVRDELTRMLTEGRARSAFELLNETGLLHEVLPEVEAFRGVEQPPEFHPEGDVWTHVLIMLEGLPESASPALAWGVLLHDVGKPATFSRSDRIRFNGHVEVGVGIARRILNRLKFSNEDADQILALVANHMRFGDVRRMKESTLKRFLRLDRFDEHLALHRLDCLSSHAQLGNYDFMRERFESMPPDEVRPPRLLTGADLIAAGYRPGPEFKRVLDEVEDAQLEGSIADKESALALAKEKFAASSAPPPTSE
ncbi:MAG: CCA tRNA nucleotidyltransferase [Bryobacteraceae bacterium]|nr:CCA tRNA nucleotidyltransferase [Bryobacteraceae bacterium]